MIVIKALFLWALGIVGTDASNSTRKCDLLLDHYIELGCTPVENEGNCPKRYECPEIDPDKKYNVCYFKKRAYNIGERIDDDLIDNSCTRSCLCEDNISGAQFECAQSDCPADFELPRQCLPQYTFRDCCSINQVCDQAAIDALKTCQVDGITYREGEEIYPKDTCKLCICDSSFNGTLSSLNCKDLGCSTEIHFGHKARAGCAPMYLKKTSEDNCCPVYWKCPESTDTIIEKKRNGEPDDKLQCNYGKRLLNIGDEVKAKGGRITCTCQVPPLLTCTLQD